ncbi:MAG: hypothetical protein RL757_3220 [Bacteroidota bacterium]|jgi:hypothetical protein
MGLKNGKKATPQYNPPEGWKLDIFFCFWGQLTFKKISTRDMKGEIFLKQKIF